MDHVKPRALETIAERLGEIARLESPKVRVGVVVAPQSRRLLPPRECAVRAYRIPFEQRADEVAPVRLRTPPGALRRGEEEEKRGGSAETWGVA